MKRKWRPYKKGDAFKPMPEKGARVQGDNGFLNAVTHELLLERYIYDEGNKTLPLVYAYDINGNAPCKGERAGDTNGAYACISVAGYRCRMHRIVFMYHNGYLPDMVDHMDRDKTNNLIGNLRACTAAQNSANAKITGTHTSRYNGVHLLADGQWSMRSTIAGKSEERGPFNTEIEAAMAYNQVKGMAFGEFASLNPVDEPMPINGVTVTA